MQLHWLTIFSHLELVHRVCPFNMWKHGTKDNRKFKILPKCYLPKDKIFQHILDIFRYILKTSKIENPLERTHFVAGHKNEYNKRLQDFSVACRVKIMMLDQLIQALSGLLGSSIICLSHHYIEIYAWYCHLFVFSYRPFLSSSTRSCIHLFLFNYREILIFCSISFSSLPQTAVSF